MKKFLSLAMLFGILFCGAGEVIFDGSSPDVWPDGKVVLQDGKVIATLDYRILLSKDFIPVTRGRTYTITGEFRVIGTPPQKAMLYFGIVPYTADGQEIVHSAIATALPHQLATLAADAKKGDTVLLLNGAKDWQFLPTGRLVFNAKADRSDLPNFDMTDFFDLSKIKVRDDGTVELVLKKPLTKDYPAGTVVRQHRSGNYFVYVGFDNKSEEWMSFSATIRNFYIGTAKVKIAMRLLQRNWPVEIRNVRVTVQ